MNYFEIGGKVSGVIVGGTVEVLDHGGKHIPRFEAEHVPRCRLWVLMFALLRTVLMLDAGPTIDAHLFALKIIPNWGHPRIMFVKKLSTNVFLLHRFQDIEMLTTWVAAAPEST